MTAQKRTKILICGAGPAGLLLTHCLASREGYDVTVHESREDPRKIVDSPRAYSLGLNVRGQMALKHFDEPARSSGLFTSVERRGVYSDSFFLHLGPSLKIPLRRKTQADMKTSKAVPSLLLGRSSLCAGMLDSLEDSYGSNVTINFESKLLDVDLEKTTATLQQKNGVAIRRDFDLIVGADGVRSSVRKALARSDVSFTSEENVLPGQFKVSVTPLKPPAPLPPLSSGKPAKPLVTLEADAVHAMSSNKAPFSLFLIPAANNATCALLSWKTSTMPPELNGEDPEKLEATIRSHYPAFHTDFTTVSRQLARQKPSQSCTVQCNRYHGDHVLLLGDAAHSTGGTLGQGANSALVDVVRFDEALDETGGDVSAALTSFSERAVPEGQALFDLLQLPPQGPLGLLYLATQFIRGVLSRVLPWVTPPTQQRLSQSLVPYSDIRRKVLFWVKWALRTKRVTSLPL